MHFSAVGLAIGAKLQTSLPQIKQFLFLCIMKKLLIFLLLAIIVLLIVYFLGPKTKCPPLETSLPKLNLNLTEVEKYIAQQEAKVSDLRPGNHARIIWANDSISKTDYSIVYLHGFSASPMESDPVVFDIAKKFGLNLHLARLADHGRSSKESFLNVNPKDWLDSAREAIAIGKIIGNKVLVMSCSTGSTLSTYLAAENPISTDAMIMYSPNFALHDANSHWLTKPWGLQLARKIFKGNYRSIEMEAGAKPYWTTTYRLEGLVNLIALVNETMTPKIFQKIKQPYLLAYYYKDENHCDQIISVPAIQSFHDQTKTPTDEKWNIPLPNVNSHVIANKHQSKDWQSVLAVTEKFMMEVLNLKPVKSLSDYNNSN